MNDYEQERSKNQEKAREPSVLDNVQIKMNSSSNDTPARNSDAIGMPVNQENIDVILPDDDIPVQAVIHKSNTQQNLSSHPPAVLTNPDGLNTDGNFDPQTDRKLMNDLREAADKNELSDQIRNDNGMFPKKDDDEIFNEKATCCRPCLVICRRFVLYLGALLSFLNFQGDILYLVKAPFFSNWIWPMIVFLVAKYLVCLILACLWMKRNNAIQRTEQQGKNMTFMMVVLEFFSDFGGLPIIIVLGLYRVLPIKHFSKEIKIGYAIEVCTSLIPVFFVILMNNAQNPKELTWLAVTAFTTHLIAILNLAIEILIVIKQIMRNSRLRKQGFRAYQRKTLEQKADSYGVRLANQTVLSIVLTVVLLVVGLGLLEGRTCDDKSSALYFGVCTPCSDDKCIDCWTGPNQCSACQDGYHADKLSGKCIKCDADTNEVRCKLCKMPNEQGVADCLQCAPGFHLDSVTKQCIDCEKETGVPNCGQCSRGECLECRRAYFFQKVDSQVTCAKCSATYEFCDKCSESKCVACNENIATFDSNGQCRECTSPWQKVENGWPDCKCPHFVDTLNGHKCRTCSDLIPGCGSCLYANKINKEQLGVRVGWDSMLSGQGQGISGSMKMFQPQYVVCTEADNVKAVDVLVNRTHEQFLESKEVGGGADQQTKPVVSSGLEIDTSDQKSVVKMCSDIIQNCSECSLAAGTVTCNKCHENFYIDMHQSRNLLYSVSTTNQCLSCNAFSPHCESCNKYNGCTRCAPTYQTISNSQGCYKCMYEWQCQ